MHCPNLSDLPLPPSGKKGWPWTEESTPLPPTTPDGKPWPKISIVTPSFNQGQFIEETIRSVLLQNYPDLEYIIMDGGSTDNSVEIIKKYEPWLTYWVSEKDDGQSDAINRGFKKTSGSVMMWINSDDMLVKKSLAVIGVIFTKFHDKVQWITGIPVFWDIDNNMHRILSLTNYNKRLISLGCYNYKALGWIMQECTAWTRNLWDLSGSSLNAKLNYAADFELWCRFSKYANLYSVSTLLGGNRQWVGQKTAIGYKYDDEIEKIIRKKYLCLIANFVLRVPLLKKLTKIYLMAIKNKNHIYYKTKEMIWEID